MATERKRKNFIQPFSRRKGKTTGTNSTIGKDSGSDKTSSFDSFYLLQLRFRNLLTCLTRASALDHTQTEDQKRKTILERRIVRRVKTGSQGRISFRFNQGQKSIRQGGSHISAHRFWLPFYMYIRNHQ